MFDELKHWCNSAGKSDITISVHHSQPMKYSPNPLIIYPPTLLIIYSSIPLKVYPFAILFFMMYESFLGSTGVPVKLSRKCSFYHFLKASKAIYRTCLPANLHLPPNSQSISPL